MWSIEAPAGLPCGAFCESRRVPQAYPPIRPQVCRGEPRLGLEQPYSSAIDDACFESRKTDKAWSPGKFACRGFPLCAPGVQPAAIPGLEFARLRLRQLE